jgi:transposase
MFVKKSKKPNGRVNLAIVEGHWEKGRSVQRTVQGFGYADEIEKEQGCDPYAYVQAICDDMNEEKAAAAASVEVTIHPAQKIDKRTDDFKNIGCAIPLAYYNMLGIERTLRNNSRNRSFDYDVNAIMRLLALERINEPSSKLAAWSRRGNYFFKSDFTDDDVYRSLDFLASVKDPVVSAMNKAIATHHDRNLKDVYYDVTNYYFEIDEEDDLRKKGVGKEGRRKPLVQMGLAQDKDGIPMGFDIFAGNTSDCLTMMPVMADIRRDTKAGRIIMVADKGLNTSNNIAAITLDKNGFVFSQSIRGTKSPAELREWAISDEGYRIRPDDEDGPDFKCKSRQDTKVIHIEDADGKKKDVPVDMKVVAFWSSKYARRARHARAETLAKAHSLIKDPASYDKAIHYGAAKYVKNLTVDKKTGEVLVDAKAVPCLDAEMIAQEERLDGYYVITTSETGLSDDRIIEIYRGLWKIEESFKVTKSYLRARPVFVWTDAHIKAHFLICYIALTIVRLIQYDTHFAYSVESIIDEIRSMNGVHLEDNWWRFYHRTDLSDVLGAAVGIDLTKKNMRLTEIKGLLAQVKGKAVPKRGAVP